MNRRALLERLSAELDRARRFRQHLSLLMVDIDHFKSINDQHGHLVGDAILREMGKVLAGAVRTVDVVARYGGEEFVLILRKRPWKGRRSSQNGFASASPSIISSLARSRSSI